MNDTIHAFEDAEGRLALSADPDFAETCGVVPAPTLVWTQKQENAAEYLAELKAGLAANPLTDEKLARLRRSTIIKEN